MRKVLLIEDDSDQAEEIVAGLADQRFEVEWASNGPEGLKMARELKPDAMIVDRQPPGLDGLGVIERLRMDQIQVPILVLSGLDAVEDRVQALRAGGDDCLTKPFALIELVARLDALLRRPCDMRETILRVGTLELDLIERTASRSKRQIKLLPREFRLLEYMMRRSDQLLTRSMLLKDVWNYSFVPKTNLVDVHIGRLRRKVNGPDEVPMIYNIRGAGFILCETASHAVASPMRALAACNLGRAFCLGAASSEHGDDWHAYCPRDTAKLVIAGHFQSSECLSGKHPAHANNLLARKKVCSGSNQSENAGQIKVSLHPAKTCGTEQRDAMRSYVGECKGSLELGASYRSKGLGGYR